jgi:hypothetical protein
MYLDKSQIRGPNGQIYTRYLLRESYRDGGKVKKRTIANVSHLDELTLQILQQCLGAKTLPPKTVAVSGPQIEDFEKRQGASVGAVLLLLKVAQELGIRQALGEGEDGKLALWQVIARCLDQGSRLSAVRLASTHGVETLLPLKNPFDEDRLYANLRWMTANQQAIEDRMFAFRYGTKPPDLYLYDVTSTYLEGTDNELAAFGYNRDKKRGKLQLVVGLLCDQEGWPVSVEVFKGNTGDTLTVASQIKKISERFGGADITLVGDRGMLKSKQIQDLLQHKYHYITAITKPQIQKMLKDGILQMSLFDVELAEVTEGEVRYILKKNPLRAKELEDSRQQRLQVLLRDIEHKNEYLKTHPGASVEIACRNLVRKMECLNLGSWIRLQQQDRQVTVETDQEALTEDQKLDGCYVIKTDLSAERASTKTVHDRYKDLIWVETAFRFSKTAALELRPVFVRKEESTRAHVFTVMLAYWMHRHLYFCWKNLDTTVQEGLRALDSLCTVEYYLKGSLVYSEIPTPRADLARLLEAAKVEIPKTLSVPPSRVSTTEKLDIARQHHKRQRVTTE